MPLPDLVEIDALRQPVQAEITVPGSKSLTNRALVLAALAHGEVTLRRALWSEDTQVMVRALQTLGFQIEVAKDPTESCNRTITVAGCRGQIPSGGTTASPLELFVGNAGTAARFLAALCCLGRGVFRLRGVPRMHERPQAALFDALRELGYHIESENDHLPALIHGRGPTQGRCTVSIEDSSQFASALLLCAGRGQWSVRVVGENAEESPYVHMTCELIKTFPQGGGDYWIEPDASSASYFWAAGWLQFTSAEREATGIRGIEADFLTRLSNNRTLPAILLRHWPESDWQIDARFPRLLPLQGSLSRETDLGDSIMTAIILAPFADHPVEFTELGRLRVQECERVAALRNELTKCGAQVEEKGHTLTVHPSKLHGAEIETYADHRMAMCFSVLGLRVPGMRIRNPACVKKTFPNFYQKLAAPPPSGLGTRILNPITGRPLTGEELFAE